MCVCLCVCVCVWHSLRLAWETAVPMYARERLWGPAGLAVTSSSGGNRSAASDAGLPHTLLSSPSPRHSADTCTHTHTQGTHGELCVCVRECVRECVFACECVCE